MISCRMLYLVVATLLFNYVEAIPRVYPLDVEVTGPVVETNVGSIRGLVSEDGDYSMFMGIPYAEVDKENFFGPSIPYPHFENTFNAFDDSATCPQNGHPQQSNQTVVGTLDCLHINVYVPNNASTDTKFPVFVSIYGGAFVSGFAGRFLFGPRFLVRHDIILVTLNYRVGPYGFMCPDIPEVPGNQGLRDQIIALRWIKNNIAAFGGDDTKITLGGQSAGGISTEFHLYYGQDEGLFHRMILQSGTFFVPGMMAKPDPTAPIRLAEYFNYAPNDIYDALSYLATIETNQIITAVNILGLSIPTCLENEYDGVERLINKHPVNVEIPRSKDVEVLIGYNDDELYPFFAFLPDIFFRLFDFASFWINADFNFTDEEELFNEMRDIVSNFYFGDKDITAELRQEVSDLASDFLFNHPTIRSVKKYIDSEVKTLYLYLFSYSGGRNLANITGSGAAHSDELGYLFDISFMKESMAPEDELIVDRMTEMWANFVKYGNPTPAPTELVPLQWPAVTKEKWHFLNINSELSIQTRPMHERMAFLDLFFSANKKYQITLGDGEEEQSEEPNAVGKVVLGISLPLLLAIKYLL